MRDISYLFKAVLYFIFFGHLQPCLSSFMLALPTLKNVHVLRCYRIFVVNKVK